MDNVLDWGGALLDGIGPEFLSTSDGDTYEGITFDVKINGTPARLHFKLMKIEELEKDPSVSDLVVDRYLDQQNLGLMD